MESGLSTEIEALSVEIIAQHAGCPSCAAPERDENRHEMLYLQPARRRWKPPVPEMQRRESCMEGTKSGSDTVSAS